MASKTFDICDDGPFTLRQLQEMTGHPDLSEISIVYAGCGSHSIEMTWPDPVDTF